MRRSSVHLSTNHPPVIARAVMVARPALHSPARVGILAPSKPSPYRTIHETTTMASEGDDLVDITDLLRSCASHSLSYTQPFTPLHRHVEALPSHDDVDTTRDSEDVLQIRGLSLQERSADDEIQDQGAGESSTASTVSPLNLRDAMSALEIGDKRMDCCEIPFLPSPAPNGGDVIV